MLRFAAILASHYGGGVWRWLAEERLPTFNAALDLLRPLEAGEDLRQLSVLSLMHGKREQHERQSAIDELRQQADRLAGKEPHDVENPSFEELLMEFRIAGWQVEVTD